MVDPRPDDPVDQQEVAMWCEHIAFLLDEDKDDLAMSVDLRSVQDSLNKDPATACAVFDQLAALEICNKATWRKWINLRDPRDS